MEKPIRFSSTQTQASSDWIPWDLWFQILCLLPVRSLVVFRSVCKSFLSIIDDPDFVSLHLRRFPGNALETRFLTHKINLNEIAFEVREINNFFTSTPFTWNNKIINRVMKPWIPTMLTPAWLPFHWHLKCSLNGLLLLSYNHNIFHIHVALWNPSIKKHRQLSLPSPEPNYLQFGLGYHLSSNDYKLVAFDLLRNQAWVYSIKMDTWSKILDSRACGKLGVDNTYYYCMSLSFKNWVFWIEHFYTSRTSRIADKLLWFDFETERFRYAEMPYLADRRTHQELMKLDGGSSVGVWRVDEEERVFVWALETDAMSWTLRYKLAPPHGLQRSISGYRVTVDSRLEERNGELVWKYWEEYGRELSVVSYDIDVETQVYRRKFLRAVQDCLDIYFESLVMLN